MRAKGWQPMITCPVDRMVIMGCLEHNVYKGELVGALFHWAIAKRREIVRWNKPWWRFKTERVQINTMADSYNNLLEFEPSHWREVVDIDDPPPTVMWQPLLNSGEDE